MAIVDVKMISGFIPVKSSVKRVSPISLTDIKVMINTGICACQFYFTDSVLLYFTDSIFKRYSLKLTSLECAYVILIVNHPSYVVSGIRRKS